MAGKKRAFCILAAIAVMLSTGCSSITLLRVQELRAVQAHVDSLKSQIADLQQEIIKEQKNQNELLRLIRADQQVRFDEIGQKISSMEGGLSENRFKLSQIDKKTEEIQEQWKAKALADSAAVSKKISQMDKLYQIAYGDFTAGRFDLAANGFIDFIKQFPDAQLADDASYWLAECSYGKKDYDKAELAYSDYIRKFREGKKLCSALFKLGLVFENKKQPEKRKMVWQKLITSCPTAQEAAVAKDRLAK